MKRAQTVMHSRNLSYDSIFIIHRFASMQVTTGAEESFEKLEKIKELVKFK